MSKKSDYIKKELNTLGIYPESISYKKPKYIPENFSDGHEGGWMIKLKTESEAQDIVLPLDCEWGRSDKDLSVLEFFDFNVVLDFIAELKKAKP